MERAIEGFVAIGFLGIGLSHLLRPLAWVEFFTWLRAQGRPGVFLEGLLNLNFGALVVAFHNVWSGLPVVITVLGWGLLLKGIVRLVAPDLSLRIYDQIVPAKAWQFRAAGVFALILSAFSAYLAIAI